MEKKPMLKRLMVIAALAGFVSWADDAQAASACKGLSSNQCGGATACYWVKGYKTKKGTNVSAHCRAKPKSSAKSSSSKSSGAKKVSSKGQSSAEKADTASKKKSSDKKKSSSTKRKPAKKKKKSDKKKKPTS